MKRLIIAAALAALSIPSLAQDPAGAVVYSLPKTTLAFDVEAVQESFYAGPYAKYAAKYLGIEVRTEDEVNCQISKVTMTPYLEADQDSRFTLNVPAKAKSSFLSLTAQGLVAFTDNSLGEAAVWRFPSPNRADFSDKGVSSNLSSAETTLYGQKGGQSVSVQQNMVVEKSPEKRAEETANLIFELRKKRVQIVTGDTDATYSGEAMGAAIEEITRLEKEYLSLFAGYSEYKPVQMRYELVPQKGEDQNYVVFRVSDKGGLVGSDEISGTPVILELTPEAISEVSAPAKPAKGNFATIRIPAVCRLRLFRGSELLLQSRVPVYQLGVESYYPIQ